MVATVPTRITATGLKVPHCHMMNHREVSVLRQHMETSELWPSEQEGQHGSGTSKGSNLDQDEYQ